MFRFFKDFFSRGDGAQTFLHNFWDPFDDLRWMVRVLVDIFSYRVFFSEGAV